MTAPAEADDLLVAELAFGLLDSDEEAAVRERLATDTALAARLVQWERLAAGLLVGGGDAPRPSLWGEIDARLPGNDTGDAAGADGWALAARWRAASIALGVLATVLGALALYPTASAPPPSLPADERPGRPPLVAVLRGARAPAAVAVTFEPASNRLTVVAEALDARTGSAELWAIAGAAAPQSLGLVPLDAPGSRTAPDAAPLIAPGVTLAVTLEPRGGSPTGAPSGAPLLTGTVAAARGA